MSSHHSSEATSEPPTARTVGSILHAAYGDYYEQMVALRLHKQEHPNDRLVLFFATEVRQRELAVFDTSFADEVHPASAIPQIHVDYFLQFQVRDDELRAGVLDKLPRDVLAKIDLHTLNLPWRWVKRAWVESPDLCDIPLSPEGEAALPRCMKESGVDASLFREKMTIGFLWRFRAATGYIKNPGQPPRDTVRAHTSELLQHFVDQHNATIIVAGMNLKVDDSNRERTDCKFADHGLSVTGDCRYLRGLSWGLELEILRRCTFCFVMGSGFSEALWLKRRGKGTVLVHAPRAYLLRLAYYRMPFFDNLKPRNLCYNWLRQHTSRTMLEMLWHNVPGTILNAYPR